MSSRCAMRWSSFPESDRALLGVKMSQSAREAFSPPGCHGRALPFLSLGDTRQHRRKHRRHRYRVENDVVLVREFGRQDGPCLLVAGPAQIRQEGVCCDFNAVRVARRRRRAIVLGILNSLLGCVPRPCVPSPDVRNQPREQKGEVTAL